SDPDLGNWTYTYDPNGNQTQSVDPRGASGTVYTCYDGLNRPTAKSANVNCTTPFASYTYDSTVSGNQGIGRLTSETFASGPSQGVTGSYAYTYDGRGRQTGWSMTINSTAYGFTKGYNDADQQTTLTYPDGDVLTTSYGAQDWLGGVSKTLAGTTTTLLGAVSYSGLAGASQLMTSGSVGNSTYTWNLNYDTNLRLTETKATRVSGSLTLFDQTRSFDATGNVLTTNTTLQAGTDNQAFCYDNLNRLTWGGSSGTPPCQSLTPGTLGGGASYNETYGYDVLDRLTTGPAGSGYTYGDASHLNAVTSTAGGYTAKYDAAGDMACRAPTSSLTCTGTVTGQPLSYDARRQLLTWQNATNSPTTTTNYAYNGDGERVQQAVTASGTTTTTLYIGTYEEISITGGTTTTTKYYQAGKVTAEAVNGTLYYLVNDDLSSVSVTLNASGSVQATELYKPYGGVRYSSGTMPTSYGFTNQRLDGSGLNYFHARYYDSGVGQFVSADSVQGSNRFLYVGGNPETRTDASGHCWLVCAVLAAVATAVVATTVDVVVQEVQHPGRVDWGQAAGIGLAAGVTVGAVIALGPLAGAAMDAVASGTSVATAVSGTTTVLFGSDAAMLGAGGVSAVAANSAIGAVTGSAANLAGGLVHGDRDGDLALDVLSGAVGGAIGGAAANVGPPIIAGMLNGGLANLAQQGIGALTKGTGFDPAALITSIVVGGATGKVATITPTSAFWNSVFSQGFDMGYQAGYAVGIKPLLPKGVTNIGGRGRYGTSPIPE
ncbi:MAG: hypothetical protein H0U76_16800, partial [Ktedonobacteraceae bacterium]|nr:hypothetical protein [Ktedonobacteraceae bacterium]